MSAGPIPWTAINEWSKRERLTETEFEELKFCIYRMDGEYRICQKEDADKKHPPKK